MDVDGFWYIFDGFRWISIDFDGFWWILMDLDMIKDSTGKTNQNDKKCIRP